MSSLAHRQRYARHLLLAEIGEGGQARLCAARVGMRADSDSRALIVARDYLERAGLTVMNADADGGQPLGRGRNEVDRVVELAAQVPDADAVRALAGCVALEEAAAALAGAFGAVEAIKMVLGVGARAELPSGLSLSSEHAP